MVSLLILSLALSAPVAATQNGVVASNPAVTQSSPSAEGQQESPLIEVEKPTQSLDPIVIQPDSDICYKIRAYVFSKGSNPRLLRETTCGPNRPAARQLEGTQPKLVPLGPKDKSAELPQK